MATAEQVKALVKSQAEVTLAAERAAKDAILSGANEVTSATLVAALKERHAGSHA